MENTSSSPDIAAPSSKRHKPTRVVLAQSTIRQPAFYYLQLALLSSGSGESAADAAQPVDELTARTCLTAALKQFLGLTGVAIPVDLLRCHGRDVWVRVPHDDAAAVMAALSAWTGGDIAWRVKGSGSWLGGLALGDGRGLFEEG